MPKVDFRLNAIVDGSLRSVGHLPDLARRAAESGATLIQYRDKQVSTRTMIDQAAAIRFALAGSGVPLVINDRIDVALAVDAEGVHLGRDDMDPAGARRLLGPGAIIGVTVKNQADADAALAAPIDYACIGGVFETLSKHNPEPPVGLDGFAALRRRIKAGRPGLPVGAIAGIDLDRARQVVRAGADGVAVISALFQAEDISAAATALRRAVDETLREVAA